MKSKRNLLLGMSALILSGTMVVSAVLPSLQQPENEVVASGAEKGTVTEFTGKVDFDISQYFDSSVVEKLPETVIADQEISVILSLDEKTVLDKYNALDDPDMTVGEFAASREGKAVSASIEKKSNELLRKLGNAGVKYEVGDRYDTLLGGVEVTIKASAFSTLCNAVKGKAAVMVGEVYAPCETQVVENTVNVVESTGIFDSSDSDYDGTGTVIAVLDTGLDYTHSAFSMDKFDADPEKDVITMGSLRTVVGQLEAAKTTPGLTPSNVFISRKVPYAYDYADKDDDVAPINSDHGTHVAGVMVGNDDVIRGVAPNAQLAVMKTFSEKQDGAKTSWIVAALEDCVTLGVDVINMSLGSAAGFSRETDDDIRYAVYDRIKEQGISLVAAGSNNYNATFGSEKNGNLGLTRNPDSATVGAPSTYDAALSVASISGVKTPYLKLGETIIYFTEASDSAAKPKDFVEDILSYGVQQGTVPAGVDSYEFEYVVIDGIGSAQNFVDYEDEFGNPNGELNGKIALIKRGQTNFEEKASLARDHGAVGCIIYNNVSGNISMNVGHLGNYPVCSLSQDDGELLLDTPAGDRKIVISRSQKAGPFMSDFSSWGPAPDLSIKPEITAHGGDIYSAIPGQSYDRMSGTSMASPNQAGVTALVRQYVKETFPTYDPVQVTATVNQIMMSTTDIAYNTNGLPFSVRKQGSGLANLTKATKSPAYLQTFDRKTNEIMDKAKIELGDDPEKNGIYTMKFNIVNFGSSELKFDADAIVMTEGVSNELTYKGDTTVSEKGYLLEGAGVQVADTQNCTHADNTVTVGARQTGTVTLVVTLTSENKSYLDASFENGMYVEGYVTLKAQSGTSYDLNAPFLAFYGSWADPPLFDLDYFATNADELDDTKETLEKTLPDAYATRPIGTLYDDYISYLGSYPFLQDPASTSKVSADRDHIALTNQTGEDGGINAIGSVQVGLLRGAKRMVATVTDTTTGEVIFQKEEADISKSYNYGGAIYGMSYDVDFSAAEYDLKNNTEYLFTLTGYIDYGDGSVANNTFEFPFYADFTAPIVTGVEYTYEYDKDTETNKLFANISVYDNHYVRGMVPGYIAYSEPGSEAQYTLYGFGRYVMPVSGERNSTSVVQVELTDYLQQIKSSSYNNKSFMVQLYDCAQNISTYELTIPDNIGEIKFNEEEIRLSPNELYNLNPVITPSQDKAWAESINYTVADPTIARVVNGKLIGLQSGTTTLTATSNRNSNATVTVPVRVLADGKEGFKNFDRPIAENFRLTGYEVKKVYYFISSDDRDLGADEAGQDVVFSGSTYSLKMLPSESVKINYDLRGYFDDSNYKVEFTSSNPTVAEVTADGTITAKNVDNSGNALNTERTTTVSVRLLMLDPATGEFKATTTTRTIYITVKAPYETNGPYLLGYKGLGGKVTIPEDLGITDIQAFAFSNYDLVPKDLSAGDEINDEDPYYSKQWFIGDNTITEVVIPEGVKTIGMYAFANLTALRSITLPSTLTKIQAGAFLGCTSLAQVSFSKENNLQFINLRAFEGCTKLASFEFNSIVAIGDSAFQDTYLINVRLPATTQSIGAGAFAGASNLKSVSIAASKVKVGAGAFNGCAIQSMELNASVLPAELFEDCGSLATLKIGADVEVIGEYALRGTRINKLELNPENKSFDVGGNGQYLLEKGTQKIALAVPTMINLTDSNITEIGVGAFSSAEGLTSVTLSKVDTIGDYAFAGCNSLLHATFGKLKSVGDYAFYRTGITVLPQFENGVTIGERAFSFVNVTNISIPQDAQLGDYAFAQDFNVTTVNVEDGVTVGAGAFFANPEMKTVTIGDNVVIGEGAFSAVDTVTGYEVMLASGQYAMYNNSNLPTYIDPYVSALSSLTIGENATIGDYAFQGAGAGTYSYNRATIGAQLTTVNLGAGATIGAYAFSGCHYLKDIDLSKVKSIGAYAFYGEQPEYLNFADVGFAVVRVNPYGSSIEKADLSGLEAEDGAPLGAGAFAYNEKLADVTLSETVAVIQSEAFLGCTALKEIDLSNVSTVGAGAFANTALKNVTLFEEGAAIGEGAFYEAAELATVGNLDKAMYIGSSAFEGTALTEADVSDAVILGSFAFADSAVKKVTLGASLAEIGENPFSGCPIGNFTDASGATTFDVSESVKVIDGVLYGSCPNGLVLTTYPKGKTEKSFKIADNVVRVGAEAFRGADVFAVELTRRVAAIGDKAFYECNKLVAVSFSSIEAPILEEQYDSVFADGLDENGIPLYLSHNLAYFVNSNNAQFGLKVVDFQMWNADPTSVLFGANFVAEIGTKEGRAVHEAKTLLMVRPINGTGYDNFIYNQYFDLTLDGPTATSDEAQRVIDLIAALPNPVSLADEEMVVYIRSLYDALNPDQQACVYNANLNVLISAETRIAFLHAQETPPVDPNDEEPASLLWLYIVIGVVGAAAIAAVVAVLVLRGKKGPKNGEEVPAEGTPSEEETPAEETPVEEEAPVEKASAEEEASTEEEAPAEEPAEESEETEGTEKTEQKPDEE